MTAGRIDTNRTTQLCRQGSGLANSVVWADGRLSVAISTGASGQTGAGPGVCARDFTNHGGDSCGDSIDMGGWLIFKLARKSTSVSPRMCIWHRTCPFWAPWGHHGHSASIISTRREIHNNITQVRGSLMVYFGPATVATFLSPQEHWAKLVSV